MKNYLLLPMLCIGTYIVADDQPNPHDILNNFKQAQAKFAQTSNDLNQKDEHGNNILHMIINQVPNVKSFEELDNLAQKEALIPESTRKQLAKEKNNEGLTPSGLLTELIKKSQSRDATPEDKLLIMKCLAFRNAASPELQEGVSLKPTLRDGLSATVGGAITFAGIWIICQICHSSKE